MEAGRRPVGRPFCPRRDVGAVSDIPGIGSKPSYFWVSISAAPLLFQPIWYAFQLGYRVYALKV
ncbi:hypothetical protein GCM10008939_29510 [Deinococcus aquiradiocola]|uniref:Uncharacterized protein n=1 Tax=Deinococcus aquiradiocola TaxID=393059 RepID=A0A917UTE5_9DEIO|nr:hypothetical protein GCM10008939_29510 [Deinococcus aquiradiocola]